jgi:hypothetical protein
MIMPDYGWITTIAWVPDPFWLTNISAKLDVDDGDLYAIYYYR